jgi:DNA-binding transcriptional LysR family regulator
MLNLDLLRVFISVAENSSFTRAASELNRSQSAISMQIKRLEEIVGAPVLQRSGKAVILSREGTVLLDYAHRILRLVDEALSTLSKKGSVQTVRVGCIEDYAARILPSVLFGFWSRHPQVHIEVDTGESAQLLKRLGEDYALVIAMHPAGSGEGELLRTEPLIWATSATQSPHELNPLPVALRPDGAPEREWGTAALDAAGRPWRCAYVSGAIGSLQCAVEEGLAVGMFKESTLTGRMRRLTAADGFPELPRVDIALHVAASHPQRHEVKLLLDELFNSLRPPDRATDDTARSVHTAA